MRRRLLCDRRGATAVEFALAAPVLISMVIGVTQLGQLFFASAGLQHTVEQAARFAAIHPTPSIEEITAKVHEGQVGLRGTLTPVVVENEVDGEDVLDISLTYTAPLDFIFFEIPDVRMTHSRRVFLPQGSSSSSSSSSSSATSASSSASSSSSGADSSTSSGTDSSTSASTSTTTTSTSTSGSSGNNSNGGGNGNNGGGKGNSNGGK